MSHCAGMAGSHIHQCPPHIGFLGNLVHMCRCRTQHDHCTGPRSGKGLDHIHLFQLHSSYLCYKTEKYLVTNPEKCICAAWTSELESQKPCYQPKLASTVICSNFDIRILGAHEQYAILTN